MKTIFAILLVCVFACISFAFTFRGSAPTTAANRKSEQHANVKGVSHEKRIDNITRVPSSDILLNVAGKTSNNPLTIAETFVQRAKLSASDATYNNHFGVSIAKSVDTMIVGAPDAIVNGELGQGAVYIFVRDGTAWREQARLTASDGRREDQFGTSVAIDGDVVLIGAPFADIGADCELGGLLCNEGAAYTFVRNGTTWTQVQKIVSVDPAPRELFGFDVEIEGDTALISEHLDSVAGMLTAGKANVFLRTGNNLMLQQRLTTSDASVELFGWSLDLDGNTIVVSAPLRLTGGAVYVFHRSATTWVQQQKLVASDADPQNFFGHRVALSGDTIVVGDVFDDIGGNANQGSAYIFTRSGTVWSQRQKLTSGGGRPGEMFGSDVGVSGETIIVSAHSERVGTSDFQGATHVFGYNGANWVEQQKLVAADGIEGSLFGISVHISNGTVVVGALNSANPGPTGETGAVYVFETLSAKTAPFDFDGDGKTDVSVFRPSERTWYLLQSSTAQVLTIPFGLSTDKIAPADFDGDGKTDIAVFRPSEGVWYWVNSSNGVSQAVRFGTDGDIPVPSDFDGDGRADINLFRPSSGSWWRLNSITGSVSVNQFGMSDDIPITADFDGDRRSDLSVFRPMDGTWYRINSIDNSFFAMRWGLNGDLPAPADFDGDGRADINVYRPSEGKWYRMNSRPGCVTILRPGEGADSAENGVIPGCIVITRFGLSGDRPTVGDFDGDGKADISLFRQSDGTWHLLTGLSDTNTYSVIRFGTNGDLAIPAAYVP